MPSQKLTQKSLPEQSGGGRLFSRLFGGRRSSKAANLAPVNTNTQRKLNKIKAAQNNIEHQKARMAESKKTLEAIWKEVDELNAKVKDKAHIVNLKQLPTDCDTKLPQAKAKRTAKQTTLADKEAKLQKCEDAITDLEKRKSEGMARWKAYREEEPGLQAKRDELLENIKHYIKLLEDIERELAEIGEIEPEPKISNVFDLPADVREYESLKEQVVSTKAQIERIKRMKARK